MRIATHTAEGARRARFRRDWFAGVCVLWMVFLGPPVGQAQTADVLVESSVSDATIRVDGEVVGQTNDEGEALVGALSPGRRTVELRKAGYWNASTRVTLEPELTTRVRLEMRTRAEANGGTLFVETNVSQAVVSVDGEQVGFTGPTGETYATDLGPGPHRVIVQKDGYEPASRTVTFSEPDLDRTVRLQLVPREGGTEEALADESSPASDSERERRGVITAGTGGPPSSPETVDTSGVSSLDDHPGRRARLIVDAGVEGGRVFVNDSSYGRTSTDGRIVVSLVPGPHRIAVEKDGYVPIEKSTRLAAGEEHTVTLHPEPASALSTVDLPLVSLFFVSLLVLAGVVAAFFIISGWKAGTFTRWFWGKAHFDRYVVLEMLRRSEFSTVHLANDSVTNQQVALKVLDDPYADKSDHVQQFLEKGRTLQRIRETDPDAPIIDVYRVGRKDDEGDGRPFIALEHLEGDNLLAHLKTTGRLNIPQAVSAIRQVCVGLRAAHNNEVYHGSLSPDNLIVTAVEPGFKIKLIGFGLGGDEYATQAMTDTTVGSAVAYTAPEQLQNGRGDWRSDMYAVGMLFYKLVTGAPPFAAEDPHRVMKMHTEAAPPDLPEHVPSYVKPVFYRMVSKDPDRRPTASRVVSVLDLIQVAA